MTLYVAVLDSQTIAIAKSKSDANRALKSKKYYVIPRGLELHRGSKIFYYELFSMYIRIFPRINDGLVGKVFNINDLKNILHNSELIDTYGYKVNFKQINSSLIDEYIQKTKKDLEKIERWKNKPKIYYFGESDIRDNLVYYAKRYGKEISDNIYFYEKDEKYMIINIDRYIGITIPKNVNILEYEKEIKQQLKDDYLRRNFKGMLKIMLDIPELQEFASSLILLDLV